MKEEVKVIKLLVLIGYLFVMGALFLILPWSNLWPHTIGNANWVSIRLYVIFSSPIAKGVVSGFGLVLVFGAIVEIHHAITNKDQ